MSDSNTPGSMRLLSCDSSSPLSSYPTSASPTIDSNPGEGSTGFIPSSLIWKKRPRTSPTPPSSRPVYGTPVKFPGTGSSTVYDKALPPLPNAARPAPLPIQHLPEKPASLDSSSQYIMTGPASAGLKVPNSSISTELATVTPAMSSASSSPSRTYTFTKDTQIPHNPTSRVIRKAKSSSKLNPKKVVDNDSSGKATQNDSEYSRTRGLSFGSLNVLNFSGDSKAKAKEKDADTNKVSLSRRGSFWSRRRQLVQSSDSPPSSFSSPKTFSQFSDTHHAQSLAVPPERQQKPQRRGLSRSLSERSFLSRSSRLVLEHGCSDTSNRSTRSGPPSQRPHTAKTSSPSSSSFRPQWPRVYSGSGESPRAQSKLRPRAQTNPPLLHRLSLNIFSFATSPSSPSCEKQSPIFLTASPSGSKTRLPIVTSVRDGETPSNFVQRLMSSVNKIEVAGILASSTEEFYSKSLQIYIDRFDFVNDPLDIAMRKFLMHVGLPRETQQIDRVIEAFGRRYLQCNPELFTSDDHPYVLAFSLMMLHTDAFNKSNKRKMTKSDYVKNTRLPGVPSEVLECFYDNIVFAPFIFIEDPFEGGGNTMSQPDSSSGRMFSSISSPSLATGSNSGTLLKSTKIDPYYLIVNNLLRPLHVDVNLFVPPENPYSYEGTAGPWDIDQLQHDFVGSTVLLPNGLHHWWQDILEAYPVPYHPEEAETAGPLTHLPPESTCGLKIVKIGLLNKKDDISAGGRKATNRKWRPWTVVLTPSHLFFFRDLSLVNTLLPYLDSSHRRIKFPHSVAFKPDDSLAINDSVAIYDQSYTKYNNVFRYVMAGGRQILLQAPFEKELNDWIARINYASTFRTAQIRIRPPNMTGRMVELTGMAAAASHLQDIQHHRQSTYQQDLYIHATDSSDTLLGDLKLGLNGQKGQLHFEEAEIPVSPEIDGADQFKATFDQVKADLAAGIWASPNKPPGGNSRLVRPPATNHHGESARLPLRFQDTQSKVKTLQERIATTQVQLDSDTRVLRNIAQLTPFQKATRDRLESALQHIARRISEYRIEQVKLLCYHDTLCRDLSSEVRSWGEAQKIAFRAAERTLKEHYDVRHSAPMGSGNNDPPVSQRARPQSGSSSEKSSSACESFHSALDTERPCSSEVSSSVYSNKPNDTPASGPNPCETQSSTPSSIHISSSDTGRTSPSVKTPLEDNCEQEEAEIWDKTRCAQRVSLVRLPSTLQIARLRTFNE